MNSISFTVEEENLICMYHHDDRRRTMTAISDALPDMGADMRQLAEQTIQKLHNMNDAAFEEAKFTISFLTTTVNTLHFSKPIRKSSRTIYTRFLKNYGYSYIMYFVLLRRLERGAYERLSLHTGNFLQMGRVGTPCQSICLARPHSRRRAFWPILGDPSRCGKTDRPAQRGKVP